MLTLEGHGMNTGLQDAFNLGWKLALARHGMDGPELLASYEFLTPVKS
jgi:2-polyprenyl-6-methoxyphenol hydroxylase-like FAD-dependent oxidoreductase